MTTPSTTPPVEPTEPLRPPTVGGKEVSEETIERLAAEAEAGYDVERLRRAGGRRPRGSGAANVVPVRLEPELEEAVRQRAAAEHTTASDVIRDALRLADPRLSPLPDRGRRTV